jgi:hypothetical protein
MRIPAPVPKKCLVKHLGGEYLLKPKPHPSAWFCPLAAVGGFFLLEWILTREIGLDPDISTDVREKHTAESVQFSTPMAIFGSRQVLRPRLSLKGFGGAICQVQGFSAGEFFGD